MERKNIIRIPVILGPTAVGKTETVLKLASEFNAEIISCDSRQIYRYMDIGTAKPLSQQTKETTHWMIDIINPSEHYSAFNYSQDALTIIRTRSKENKTLFICGGTGLYFRTLREGPGPLVGADLAFREKYLEKAHEEGNESIHRELRRYDPETASRLHPNDIQRVIRALQVYHQTGDPLSSYREKKTAPPDIEFFALILTLPRNKLYDRINRRVEQMLSHGLWDEFCSLIDSGYTSTDPGMQCVGYKELFDVKRNIGTIAEAAQKIKQNTRNYAKRQITWFRNKENGLYVDMAYPSAYIKIKEAILKFLEI